MRKAALARFGPDAIRDGTPMAQLEDTLVPLYLLHRYQTEAATKWIGGLNYRYAVRGDGGFVTEPLPAAQQREALKAVLATLSPQALTLPESLLRILPPRPPDYPRTGESFGGHTGLTFDPEGPVEAAAELTASLLFNPSRASRLVEDHARDPEQLGLEEVLDTALAATWRSPRLKGLEAETQFTVENVILNHLLQLAASGGGCSQSTGAALPAGMSLNVAASGAASGQARAVALAEIDKLEKWLKTSPPAAETSEVRSPPRRRHRGDRAIPQGSVRVTPPPGVPVPPGQPIGDDDPGNN